MENDARKALRAIRPGGLLIFHDYRQPAWPDVAPVLEGMFANRIQVHETLAVVQC